MPGVRWGVGWLQKWGGSNQVCLSSCRGWGAQINQKERFSDYTVTGTEELRGQTGNDWTKISHLITGMWNDDRACACWLEIWATLARLACTHISLHNGLMLSIINTVTLEFVIFISHGHIFLYITESYFIYIFKPYVYCCLSSANYTKANSL